MSNTEIEYSEIINNCFEIFSKSPADSVTAVKYLAGLTDKDFRGHLKNKHNIHIAGKSREEFVALRTARDATLAMPKLIIPSLQVNMRGGDLPPPDEDGKRYLKVPINGL